MWIIFRIGIMKIEDYCEIIFDSNDRGDDR